MHVFHQGQAVLGEGTLWLEASQRVCWVDIEARTINCRRFGHDDAQSWNVSERPTAIAPWFDDTLILASERALSGFSLHDGSQIPLLRLNELGPDIRLNDGTTDPSGRFWVGSMDEATGNPLGKIYCLDRDGRMSAMLDGVGIANGITFADQGRTMYFADSAAGEIYRCDVNPATGELSSKSLFVGEGVCPGTPDGAALDQEGYLWSCRWDGWGIARFSPNGTLERFIDLPVSRPTRCAFGGPEMTTLYTSTARTGLSDSELAAQPNAGSILQISAPAAGVTATPYSGTLSGKFTVDEFSW